MKKRSPAVMIMAIVMLLILLIPGLSNLERALILVLFIIVVAFLKRGMLFFAVANKHLMSRKNSELPKAIKYYKRALKAGVSPDHSVTIGTILIQNGELEAGMKALEKVISSKVRFETIATARIAMSMAYWSQKNIDKAIEECLEVMDTSYRDRNLYINLSTYQLYKGDIKGFHTTMKDLYASDTIHSPAITDLTAVDQILYRKNWQEAGVILSGMFDDNKYDFADPYIHMAQVKLHYGNVKSAIEYLEKCLKECRFSSSAIIGKELVENVLATLKNEGKAKSFSADNESDPIALINGRMPEKTDKAFVPETEPDFAKLLKARKEKKEEKPQESHTDLTDADEEWLKKHNS